MHAWKAMREGVLNGPAKLKVIYCWIVKNAHSRADSSQENIIVIGRETFNFHMRVGYFLFSKKYLTQRIISESRKLMFTRFLASTYIHDPLW